MHKHENSRSGDLPEGDPAGPPVDFSLLLWAIACGLTPDGGWFAEARLAQREVAAIASDRRTELGRMRLYHAIGRRLDRELLAVLLRARLAEMLLGASTPRELAEAVRVFERLPDDAPMGPAEDLSLDEAIDEARRLLRELDSDPYEGHPDVTKPVIPNCEVAR